MAAGAPPYDAQVGTRCDSAAGGLPIAAQRALVRVKLIELPARAQPLLAIDNGGQLGKGFGISAGKLSERLGRQRAYFFEPHSARTWSTRASARPARCSPVMRETR